MTDRGDAGAAPAPRRRMRRGTRLRLGAGLVLAVVLAVVAVLLLRPSTDAPATATATPVPPTPTPSASSPPSPCDNPAGKPFRPTHITVPGAVRNASVIALPRDGNDVPSVPPVSEAGKREFAWDRPPGIKPGSPHGNVLLNAHTWPDGSALGNRLLDELRKGDRIIVRGKHATLCYEVDRQVKVLASKGYPAYFDREGPPQVALIVCSGRRLGPGQWTHRTIWFASPVQA